jgi:hypothetical protein
MKGVAMTIAPTPVPGRHVPHRQHVLIVTLLALLAVAIVLLIQHDVFQGSSGSSGVRGSGLPTAESRTLPPFSRVEVAGSNDVKVHVGIRQYVVVHADTNLVEKVTTEVRAGELVVDNRAGTFTARTPMRVDVGVRSLDSLTLSGSGVISVTGVNTRALSATLSGSGVLSASGTATRLDVTLGGSGDAQLQDVIARDVRAVVTGSGRITVTATKSLDASVPGSGAIFYGGDPPQVTTSITGSGAVLRT